MRFPAPRFGKKLSFVAPRFCQMKMKCKERKTVTWQGGFVDLTTLKYRGALRGYEIFTGLTASWQEERTKHYEYEKKKHCDGARLDKQAQTRHGRILEFAMLAKA